jgi:hypothetical protein
MGRSGGSSGDCAEILAGPRKGRDGSRAQGVSCSRCSLGGIPELLTPLGKKRDLAAALEGAERGKKVMSRQMYKIKQEIADIDRVALEVGWVGTLAVSLDPFRLEGR